MAVLHAERPPALPAVRLAGGRAGERAAAAMALHGGARARRKERRRASRKVLRGASPADGRLGWGVLVAPGWCGGGTSVRPAEGKYPELWVR